ncbi:MAG: AI-2E family transporter [Myxococcales bacterium]|nr:AI-2E family transporter [Myxococcales bacterium]
MNLYRRIGFGVIVLFFVAVVLFFRRILLPFILGSLIVFILEPLVLRLTRLKVPRAIAVFLVLGGLLFGIGGFGYVLVPRLQKEVKKVTEKFELLLTRGRDYYEKLVTNVAGWIQSTTGGDVDGKYKPPKPSEWGFGPDLFKYPDDSSLLVPYLPEQRLPIREDEIRELENLVQVHKRSDSSLSKNQLDDELSKVNLVMVKLDKRHWGVRLNDQTFHFTALGDDHYSFVPKVGRHRGPKIKNFRKEVETALWDGLEKIATKVVSGFATFAEGLISGLMGVMIGMVITFMVAAFLLIDVHGIVAYFDALVPQRWRADYDDLKQRLGGQLGNAIRGQLAIAAIDGILCGIGFAILIPEYTVVLAFLCGSLALIPIFGTIISLIPCVLIGFSYSAMTAVWVFLWIMGVHFVDANIMSPKVIGSSVKINPVIIIFVLIAGEHAFGAVGALLAVPTTAIIQAILGFVWARIRPANVVDA